MTIFYLLLSQPAALLLEYRQRYSLPSSRCTAAPMSNLWLVTVASIIPLLSQNCFGQASRKPLRAEAPAFSTGQFESVFFEDPASQLNGSRPAFGKMAESTAANNSTKMNSSAPASEQPPSVDPQGWKELIAPNSLEDLIKAGKLRLDKIVTTPAAFKGGGFVDARTEFSLQALLFAIIESYPADVRWKSSSTEARQLFTRVAANTKIGSDQVFAEAKARLLDLNDLMGGTPLVASKADAEEIDWSNLIDRVPLMHLLDWAHQENLSKLVASEAEFKNNGDAVQRYAELIAVLGKVALGEEMPDATDDDYATLAKAMMTQAKQVSLAVKTGNADIARSAAAQIGQTCTNCHDNFQ